MLAKTTNADVSIATTSDDATTTVASDFTSELVTSTEAPSMELSLTASLGASITTAVESETYIATSTEPEIVSSSKVPAAIPTYSLLANGGNLNNQQPQSNMELASPLIFDPASPQTGGIRIFTIEPTTGHLQDSKSGAYVCAYYGGSRDVSSPPLVRYCDVSQAGSNQAFDYLTCRVVGGALSCTLPRTTCECDDDKTVCTTPAGNDVYSTFYTNPTGFSSGG
ncbi:unnamed protein product [Fusarium equiseti]|uniref:Uncharacterized protein n=1 Tax=Fusarium equiseti TaxID=61235 RepID=A0A8J2NC30_FUSEQ|nr:unnamed protein product [Fusarium equiseti]